MMSTWFYGMATGFSLIVAIGAQNAFVLKQGLKQQHILWICLICAISDSILILFGVLGFASLIEKNQQWVAWAKYFGAAFLLLYGLSHLWAAYKNQSSMATAEREETSWLKVILLCLAMTWLNPHVYLDTVLLVGVISLQFNAHPYLFAGGVMLSSWIFFFSLGYGARLLLPLFQSARSWQCLDILIAMMMTAIAYQLVF